MNFILEDVLQISNGTHVLVSTFEYDNGVYDTYVFCCESNGSIIYYDPLDNIVASYGAENAKLAHESMMSRYSTK